MIRNLKDWCNAFYIYVVSSKAHAYNNWLWSIIFFLFFSINNVRRAIRNYGKTKVHEDIIHFERQTQVIRMKSTHENSWEVIWTWLMTKVFTRQDSDDTDGDIGVIQSSLLLCSAPLFLCLFFFFFLIINLSMF